MHLRFTFSNRSMVSPVDFDAPISGTPLELTVVPSSKMKQELYLYINALSLLFRGLTNYSTSDIIGVSVSKGLFGSVVKNQDSISWNAVVDKTYTIVYEISATQLTDHVYVADGLAAKKTKDGHKFEYLWLKGIFKPDPAHSRENVTNAIVIATERLQKYALKWGENGLCVVEKGGKVVNIDDVSVDEEFVFLSLLLTILSKARHVGVFLVDASGFSDDILLGLLDVAKYFMLDNFIFFYNMRKESKVSRYRLELPSFIKY